MWVVNYQEYGQYQLSKLFENYEEALSFKKILSKKEKVSNIYIKKLLDSTLQETYESNDRENFAGLVWTLRANCVLSEHDCSPLKEILNHWDFYISNFPNGKVPHGDTGYKIIDGIQKLVMGGKKL